MSGKRVLVVDDTMFFRTALSDLLRREDWEVMEADGGAVALQIALRELPNLDLILLDLQMPEPDGFETLRRLRNEEAGRSVPVLAMTAAKPDLEQIHVLQSLGATGFVDKSLKMSELRARIHAILEGAAGEEGAGGEGT